MAQAVPRELAIGAVLILCQLIYSQIYPLYVGWSRSKSADAGSPDADSTVPDFPLVNEAEADAQAAPTTSENIGTRAASEKGQSSQETNKGQEKEIPSQNQDADFFAGSKAVRKRPSGKKKGPKFRVGDTVRDKILFSRGVVVGWDGNCVAPDWWRRARLASKDWALLPHYLVLADIRDIADTTDSTGQRWNSTVNLTFYAPEVTLERLREGSGIQPIITEVLPLYFTLFDNSAERYIPTPDLAHFYPDDVDRHYRANPDALPDTDAKGQPLLRVLPWGRLIAHGQPVPVVRRGMFLVATEDLPGDMFGKTAILLLKHNDDEGTLGVIVNKNVTEDRRGMHLKAASLHVDSSMSQLQQLQRQVEQQGGDPRQLQSLAEFIEKGEALIKLVKSPGVELRIGGPVGLEQFPVSQQEIVLHTFKHIKGSRPALAGSGSQEDPDLFYNTMDTIKKKDILAMIKYMKESKGAGRVIVFQGNSGWGAKQLAGEIRGSLHGASSWGWMSASSRDVLLLSGGTSSSKDKSNAARGSEFWRRLVNSSALQRLE